MTTHCVQRGDIYTLDRARRLQRRTRPVVVIQDDRFDATASVTVVPFTTSQGEALLLQIPVQPSVRKCLAQYNHLMVDKVTTVPRANLVDLVGRLSDADVIRLNRALLFLVRLAA